MSFTKCPVCGKIIGSNAIECIHCNASLGSYKIIKERERINKEREIINSEFDVTQFFLSLIREDKSSLLRKSYTSKPFRDCKFHEPYYELSYEVYRDSYNKEYGRYLFAMKERLPGGSDYSNVIKTHFEFSLSRHMDINGKFMCKHSMFRKSNLSFTKVTYNITSNELKISFIHNGYSDCIKGKVSTPEIFWFENYIKKH